MFYGGIRPFDYSESQTSMKAEHLTASLKCCSMRLMFTFEFNSIPKYSTDLERPFFGRSFVSKRVSSLKYLTDFEREISRSNILRQL